MADNDIKYAKETLMKMFIIIAYTIFIPLAVRFNNYDIENIKNDYLS